MLIGMAVFILASCGNSSTTTTAVPTTSPGERLKSDLQQAEQDLKDWGHDAAENAKPELQRARAEARRSIHDAAQRIADSTTEPGGQATTIPVPQQ
jgi:ElaB/YqjD/DUF883 family membrane-anchored ribosome-binding protein